MLQLNLFHEQQQFQRERELDPVRLTLLGGILIVACMTLWVGLIYLKMGSLRSELASSKKESEKLKQELKALEPLTDLPKIQAQAQTIHDRIMDRVLIATQLDLLRNIIPPGCQLQSCKTKRDFKTTEIVTPGKKGPIVTQKITPALEMLLEVNARAKDRVSVLQVRDNLIDLFHREPRYRKWVVQKPSENDGTNMWNEVSLVSSVIPDPKAGETAVGVFNFKIPFVLKDLPANP